MKIFYYIDLFFTFIHAFEIVPLRSAQICINAFLPQNIDKRIKSLELNEAVVDFQSMDCQEGVNGGAKRTIYDCI